MVGGVTMLELGLTNSRVRFSVREFSTVNSSGNVEGLGHSSLFFGPKHHAYKPIIHTCFIQKYT